MRRIGRRWCVVFVFVLALSAWATAAAAQSPATGPVAVADGIAADPDARLYRQQLAAAHAWYQAGDFDRAGPAFARALDDPRFATLDAAERHALLSAAAWSRAQHRELESARDLYLRATSLVGTDPDDWYRLALVELDMGHHDAAAVAFTRLVEGWPELLVNLDPLALQSMLYGTEPDSPARLGMMQALFDANWRSAGGMESNVWYQLALRRVIRGERDLARAPIRRVTDPWSILHLRVDKRFDGLVDRDAWSFDVGLAAKRWVERLRQDSASTPDRLEPRVQLSYAMLTAGMHDELLALVDDTLAAITGAAPGKQPFVDLEQQAWLMNNRAIALRRLGRHDEALAELERASHLTEHGEPNVSQALNLGQFRCQLGRPEQALQAIAHAGDDISGYGKMVEASVRHCAALQLGDGAGAREALDYLEAHRDDGQIIYMEGLLNETRLDAAAEVLLELLDLPDERAGALALVQEYDADVPFPFNRKRDANLKALIARPEVRAAIDRVGRIEHQPIHTDF